MSEDETRASQEPAQEEEQDTEGHNVWINPTISRDVATSRSRDVEREARDRQRARETRHR